MCRASGLPTTLSAAGVQREQLAAIAHGALNDGALTYNPAEVNYQEAMGILERVF